jgi:flagellar biosynthesis protein
MPERERAKAVALTYHADLPAPFLVAKADGRAVERFMAIAADSGVPIVRDKALVKALYPLEIGAYIPEGYFEIVAKVFAFVKMAEES